METILDFIDDKKILDNYLGGISKKDYLKYNSKNNKLMDLYIYFKSINNDKEAEKYLNQISDIDLINDILQKDVLSK